MTGGRVEEAAGRRSIWQLRAVVIIGFCLAACRGAELASGVSDSTFVRVMGALRRLPVGGAIDSVARNRARDSILRANGLTRAQLESTTVLLSRDPARASELWKAIERRAPGTPP